MKKKLFFTYHNGSPSVTFVSDKEALDLYELINKKSPETVFVPVKFPSDVTEHDVYFDDDGCLCIKEKDND